MLQTLSSCFFIVSYSVFTFLCKTVCSCYAAVHLNTLNFKSETMVLNVMHTVYILP